MHMNNEQRMQKLRDDNSWEALGYIQAPADSNNDLIKVERLKGYPIIRISARMYFNGEDKFVILGHYATELGYLKEIYNKTLNQCVDIMRATEKNSCSMGGM